FFVGAVAVARVRRAGLAGSVCRGRAGAAAAVARRRAGGLDRWAFAAVPRLGGAPDDHVHGRLRPGGVVGAGVVGADLMGPRALLGRRVGEGAEAGGEGAFPVVGERPRLVGGEFDLAGGQGRDAAAFVGDDRFAGHLRPDVHLLGATGEAHRG